MLRAFLATLLLALLVPIGASASSGHAVGHRPTARWLRFSDPKLGVSFRYPQGWRLIDTNLPTTVPKTLSLTYQGKATYALNTTILAMAPARSLQATVQRYVAVEKKMHNTLVSRARWSRAALGGVPAMVAVLRNPPTEGGVTIANAVYVAQWRSHVYEVTLFAEHRPAPSTLGQFPAVYLQILSTWRFI